MGLIRELLLRLFPPVPEKLAEVRLGSRVVVRGEVLPRDLIESPLTGMRCVYYQYTVEDYRRSIGPVAGDGFWQLVEQDEAIVEFYLVEESGQAIVAPHSARVERGPGVGVKPIELGIPNRRAQELVIRPGDLVEIHAMVDQVEDLFDDRRTYRDRPTRLLLRAPPGEHIEIRLLRPTPRSEDTGQSDSSTPE